MEAGYYPGCSLEATARDYQESIDGVTQTLDIRFQEVTDWNCCGATAAHSLDHGLALNLAARNLFLAAAGPQPVVAPCALCFNRLKAAQHQLEHGGGRELLTPEIAALEGDAPSPEVVELNQFLTTPEMIARAADQLAQPLAGLKPVVYYGCQGQRPPAITGNPHYENPTGIDKLLTALGAEVRDWPFRTDCCGASHAVARPDIVRTLAARLYVAAYEHGANCLVTGCQMCQANLDMYQTEIAAEMAREVYLPVFYFTELMGLALGHARAPRWLGRHMVSPRELMSAAGLPRGMWDSL